MRIAFSLIHRKILFCLRHVSVLSENFNGIQSTSKEERDDNLSSKTNLKP